MIHKSVPILMHNGVTDPKESVTIFQAIIENSDDPNNPRLIRWHIGVPEIQLCVDGPIDKENFEIYPTPTTAGGGTNKIRIRYNGRIYNVCNDRSQQSFIKYKGQKVMLSSIRRRYRYV